MDEDIKGLLRDTVGSPPPSGLTSATVLAAGKRTLMWRRFAYGGGAVAGIAALTVLTVAFGGVMGGGGAVLPALSESPSEPPPTGTVAPLPDDLPEDLYWLGGGWSTRTTDSTRAYDEAFWSHLETAFPGYEDLTQEAYEALPDDNFSSKGDPTGVRSMFTWTLMDLATSPDYNGSTVYTAPVYSLRFVVEDSEGFPDELISSTNIAFPGTEYSDDLEITVWRAGTFTNGLDGAGLIECEDYKFGGDDVEDERFDCGETTGPDGELVRTQWTEDWDGTLRSLIRTVVLYRSDGSAVTVSASIPGATDGGSPTVDNPDLYDRDPNLIDKEPNLSVDELIGIAAALPLTPVEAFTF